MSGTATPPSRISLPAAPTPAEVFDLSNTTSASGSPYDRTPNHHSRRLTRRSFRPSFSTVGNGTVGRGTRRGSMATTGFGGGIGDETDLSMKLPSLVPGIRPAYSTPLPVLPMVVLCIAMLSELLSANLSTPFLLKMVEGFFLSSGREKNSETEAAVGLWTGNLVSVFFITQFFTSLLWSSIADKHGRRAVLVASLAGSAVALITFGTSESLPEAICVRLVQGIFGGAVGVFRGSIRDITDDTNATRAYAVLGFSWGFGGVIGPIFGGVFESPGENFPNNFLGRIGLFHTFPYLLPTLFAGVILMAGAVLSCFLSWDGGVRGGSRIALPIEKNEPLVTPEPSGSPAPSQRTAVPVPSLRPRRSFLSPGVDVEPNTLGASVPHARRDSRASLGTAYGYGGIRSKHPTLAARAALEAARRVSGRPDRVSGVDDEDDEGMDREPSLGFARKLLLANEENTFNINDLWVSAAVAQDTAVFDDDDDEEEDGDENDDDNQPFESTPQHSLAPTPNSTEEPSSVRVRRKGGRVVSGMSMQRSFAGHRYSTSRRFSTTSGQMPAIFGNTGLADPPQLYSPEAVASPTDPFFPAPNATQRAGGGGLGAIPETHANEHSPLVEASFQEPKQSTWKALPLLMILQYGLLALHNTTHDQLFLSFLVTPYKSGGIGLNPANFSFIIALMCLFQLIYQFYLYPRLGPPLGPFSHLQMFRIGCSLYVPAYLALPLLHSVASPDKSGGFITMTLLTIITATRYCGGTLAYTSVMVLINALSPPHVVGLANGLAQSTVSFARFFGPVFGGALWSASINGDPTGYYKGFFVVTIGCIIQWSLSFLIR